MNEYTKVRNSHDRAVILTQLVNADAIAAAAQMKAEGPKIPVEDLVYCQNYEQSRAELWKLIGPAEEGAASEA